MVSVTAPAELPLAGAWSPGDGAGVTLAFEAEDLCRAAARVREPAHVVRESPAGRVGVAFGGELVCRSATGPRLLPLIGTLPPLYPEWLGDRSFGEVHRVRFPYVAGEMANGIATTTLVIAMARAGMLGFFGAAGLSPERVEGAVATLQAEVGERGAWGVNLIHAPMEGDLEDRVADVLIRRGVRTVSASAFLGLTPAVVRCSAEGLRTDPSGRIVRGRQLFVKLSRPEVAARFLSPAPADLLSTLVERGLLSRDQAALAAHVPVAEDITVEADSAGHTDGRPLSALLPSILVLRNELSARHRYPRPIRVGAAGGLGTPGALAAAFALGAAYVLTGSINQAALESGLSDAGKAMLREADLADVAMAPAADMFELGARVQVLKRGTLFAARAVKLHDAYLRYESLESLPADVRSRLETEVLRATVDEAWETTARFWRERDPREVEKALADPRHRMALTFRSYLGLSSKWAIAGDARQDDYQIWCGPAMGAFNRWVKGSFLSDPGQRGVVPMALNLLEGAAAITRAQQLRSFGAPIPAEAFDYRPRPLV